jgi:hypothetical protein
MFLTCDPRTETPGLVSKSRELSASIREVKQMLRSMVDATTNRIVRSEEIIKETDETVARWGSLAARPSK